MVGQQHQAILQFVPERAVAGVLLKVFVYYLFSSILQEK